MGQAGMLVDLVDSRLVEAARTVVRMEILEVE